MPMGFMDRMDVMATLKSSVGERVTQAADCGWTRGYLGLSDRSSLQIRAGAASARANAVDIPRSEAHG